MQFIKYTNARYYFFPSVIFFLLIIIFLPSQTALAQFPSFEVYSSTCGSGINCTPYPLVENVKVTKDFNHLIITAHVVDVSGVSSVVANIEDPNNPGQFMSVEHPEVGDGVMYDDGYHLDGNPGDGIYGTIIDISDSSIWDSNANYYIDISATDNLGIPSGTAYNHISNFTISAIPISCATSNGASVCIDITPSLISSNTASQSMAFNLSSASSAVGQQITLTATLSSSVPGESVTFLDTSASSALGTAITNASGIASYSYYPSFSGTHTIEAVFAGDSINNLAPSDKQLSLTVTGNCATSGSATVCISTTPSLISSNTSSQSIAAFTTSHTSTTITLTATLSSAISGETISFIDTTLGALASQTTDSSGVATYTYNRSWNNATHTIEAVFTGDSINNLAPSDNMATVTLP